MWVLKTCFIFVTIFSSSVFALICSRYPAHTFTPKSPVDENFVISIQGNPQTYILGQEYNISLNAFNGLRYLSFSLVLENEGGDTTYHEDLGHFEVTDPVETRYSPNCVNMIESTNTNPKNRIDVSWIAPREPGNGCILIRATVLQHRDVWYMDDGGLTRKICEEVVDDVESRNIQQSIMPCCACDEARYEITFEGVWSRNLHPRFFPAKGWITRFSDIIGAAHTGDYRFWEYGALATPAMREFGEHGSALSLERELNMNFRNGQIRTIIKARGPAFPNLNGISMASVRVDPQHHLVSLASKIEPSPDWIVGVSGLELCHSNCTWLEQKVINLYPWDLGTDAGPSYTSPNQPQVPPDVIRRIRSDFPNDPRSPFFDETGAPMKPLATLTIKRQRLYERSCPDEESNNVGITRECFTHPWTEWSQCTATCGEGKQYRTRVFKQPEVARIYECEKLVQRRQDRDCMGTNCGDNDNAFRRGSFQNQYANQDVDLMNPDMEQPYGRFKTAECELSAWSSWSPCNVTCGEGKKMRTRNYLNTYAEQSCQNARFSRLVEYERCIGQNCFGDISNQGDYNYNSYDQNKPYVPERFPQEELYPRNSYDSVNSRRQNVQPNFYEKSAYGEDNTATNYENLNTLEQQPYVFKKDFPVGNLKGHSSRNPSETDHRNSRYQNQQNEVPLYEKPSSHFQRPDQDEDSPTFYGNNNNYEAENSYENPESPSDLNIPSYCYEPLQIFNCLDTTVVGNFWFYNFCEDECMLYAADSCDNNKNKFSSLEMCEMRCRHPAAEQFLQQIQREQCPTRWQSRDARLRSGKRKWRY